MRWLVFMAALGLLVSPALVPYAQAQSKSQCKSRSHSHFNNHSNNHYKRLAEGDRGGRSARRRLGRHHVGARRVLCPGRQHLSQRRRLAAASPGLLLGGTATKAAAHSGKSRSASGARLHPVLASYAVQFKAGLTSAERDAAMATLRDKYKLKIIKINKALDILRVAPRAGSPPAGTKPPKSLGAALTPKIIQDLRKEPFVDAAYVDFPVGPKAKPARP